MVGLAKWLWAHLFVRLQIFLGVIGGLCLLLAAFNWNSQSAEMQMDEASSAITRKQLLVERANGIVYAVVMESRGLYMADTPEKIERFGKGLERHLVDLEKTRDAWKALVDVEDAKAFEAFSQSADTFIRLRRELVAEARKRGAEGARAVGDNEANRTVRTAFNGALEALAKGYAERLVAFEAREEARHRGVMVVTNGILGLVLLMTLGGWAWTARYMSRPFNAISEALGRINAGNTAFEVESQGRADEVGGISRAIEQFRQMLIQRDAAEKNLEAEHAGRAARQGRLEQAVRAFEAAATSRVSGLSGTAQELHQAAGALSTGAEETARQADRVSEASTEMNGNIESLASVGGQLASAIGEISHAMGHSNAVSEQAHGLSQSMATKFSELEQVVSSIGAVVDLINQIAGQTNLLALNATIEAARAGEAGKGFAVVAQEVKQLAAQTTRATADISQHVAQVQSVTGESIAAVTAISSTIEDMRRISMEVAAAVEQQRSASEEIAHNVRAAAGGTQSVSDNIAGVAQAADQTGSASMRVLNSASKLSEEAGGLREEVDRFLRAIRTA